ncbi:hypothetical protein JXM83_07570, partial [Candidatus Woesearchaeota archaeon]|nr:hypothetical protein [Candidatus Woesearchaeota archaeon]
MFVDIFSYFSYDLNKLAILMIILFVFFSIVRAHVILKIMNHLKEEFTVFYLELDPKESIKLFFMSGGTFFFSFKYIFGNRYILDDYLKGKKK